MKVPAVLVPAYSFFEHAAGAFDLVEGAASLDTSRFGDQKLVDRTTEGFLAVVAEHGLRTAIPGQNLAIQRDGQ